MSLAVEANSVAHGSKVCYPRLPCIYVELLCCHCHPLSLASVKSRLVLPFWYRLTRVVPDKGLLNGCCCIMLIHSSNTFTSRLASIVYSCLAVTTAATLWALNIVDFTAMIQALCMEVSKSQEKNYLL